jgi:hypothetical protein
MRKSSRHTAITLALAAMVLRALLPTGWMPNPAGFAVSPLIICQMDMSVPVQMDMRMPMQMDMSAPMDMDMSMPMDMHGGHSPGHDRQQNNETCPFAAAPHLAQASFYVPISEPTLATAAFSPFKLLHARADRAHYSPHSPRAPPSFA